MTHRDILIVTEAALHQKFVQLISRVEADRDNLEIRCRVYLQQNLQILWLGHTINDIMYGIVPPIFRQHPTREQLSPTESPNQPEQLIPNIQAGSFHRQPISRIHWHR